MPEYRGVVERTFYANLGVVAANKKEATLKLRELAEALPPSDYEVASPMHLLVTSLKREEPIAADELKDNYIRTLVDVMSEENKNDPPD